MSMYKPTELHAFLNSLGIAPRKGLSQNFLIDGNILRKIISSSEVMSEDLVLEIGPGPGSLTQLLLETGAHVIAVEKDRILAETLSRMQTEDLRLKVYSDDIMTFPVESVFSQFQKRAKIIANLPYHLTTPILSHFIPLRHLFSSLTVMVQEEVGRRMTAKPDTEAYGSLTVYLSFFCQAHYAFKVSRNCFHPVPKVDSAVVVLELKEPPLPDDEIGPFFKLTRTAFEHRRKMLRGSLRELYIPEKIEKALEKTGKLPTARPEMLSLDDFLALYQALKEF